ncbi:MAG: hypothetical protein RJA76_2213 [Bacteroidota bacterium]|jgi:membrane fusion protein (multidrug efflux system)
MSDKAKAKSNLPKIILGVVLLAALIYGINKYHYVSTHEDTDNAQIESYFVPVLSRAAGYVKSVHINDFEEVKKGDTLLVIDDAEAQLTLEEMKADVEQAKIEIENAKANISNLEKSLLAQKSQVTAAQVNAEKFDRDLATYTTLEKNRAITRQQYLEIKDQKDLADIKLTGAKADFESSESKKAILTSLLRKAENALKLKEIKVKQQELKLSYFVILAPENGKIGKKSVEPGQFIQVSQPMMTIVDDSQYWVVANFKETQVGNLKVGQKAEIILDAYPNDKLEGEIISISESTGAKASLLPPDNASGNFVKVSQRVPVKIAIKDLSKVKNILRAGLSLEVSIPIK